MEQKDSGLLADVVIPRGVRLTILGLEGMKTLLQDRSVLSPRFDAVISINDVPGSLAENQSAVLFRRSVLKLADRVLYLEFEDVEDSSLRDAPQLRDVLQLQLIADRLPENAQVLLHCRAGISRSTAAAMILLERLGLSPEQSFAAVKAVRSCADPNELMLKLARSTFRSTFNEGL